MSLRTLNRLESSGALATPDECDGCGEDWEFGGWGRRHGCARCANCGVLYCIVDYEDDDKHDGPERIHTDAFTEAVGAFYERHGTRWDEDDRFPAFVHEHFPELIEDD